MSPRYILLMSWLTALVASIHGTNDSDISAIKLLPTSGPQFPNIPASCDISIIHQRANFTIRKGVQPTVSLGTTLAIFVSVGILAALVAFAFHNVRRVVYHDADNLDTTFDAGGKVTIGLTATTLVSQMTWSATLLQSCTVASKYGISGPYWYAAGATFQVFIFSILSIHLKMRAPGAKTFLQVIKARFGKRTHLTYCVFAIFTNIVIMILLVLSGCAVLSSLVKGLSQELSIILLTAIIGCYTLIGGLGATFYVAYFNSAIIYILILALVIEVYYNPYDRSANIFGSSDSLYRYLECANGPEGNRDGSYLTFISHGGIFFGVINIVSCFGMLYCDQAYWQSSVAAKPLQGVWGFICGGLTWFAVPFSMATTMGLAYLGLTAAQGEDILTPAEIDQGLVAPVVTQVILGTKGEYTMIVLILMAVMSTGSAEVIAVSSIVIYDMYQSYLKPFKEDVKSNECILCEKPLFADKNLSIRQETCDCNSATCSDCTQDTIARSLNDKLVKPSFSCKIHGQYRQYLEVLLHYKNWCIVWTTLSIIPIHLVCYNLNLNLSWLYLFAGIPISSTVVPITLTLIWARLNEKGMEAGVMGGCLCGIASWLGTASTYPEGLSNFLENTGHELPMLVGNSVSILTGGFLCIVVTLLTSKTLSREEINMVWEKTRNIDNPLSPWIAMYKKELNIDHLETYHERPSLDIIAKTFRSARITAYIAGAFLTIIMAFVWPGSVMAMNVLSSRGFLVWTSVTRGWTYISAAFIIIVPLVQEIVAIRRKIKKNSLKDKIAEKHINDTIK